MDVYHPWSPAQQNLSHPSSMTSEMVTTVDFDIISDQEIIG